VLEVQPAPSTTAIGRSSKGRATTKGGGVPKSATANLRRNKRRREASLVAMGGVGRPLGTLAVEGKHVQATPIWLTPSGASGVPRSLDKATPTNQLPRAIDVAAFVAGPRAQCWVAHLGKTPSALVGRLAASHGILHLCSSRSPWLDDRDRAPPRSASEVPGCRDAQSCSG
jgi:hypothetical protein